MSHPLPRHSHPIRPPSPTDRPAIEVPAPAHLSSTLSTRVSTPVPPTAPTGPHLARSRRVESSALGVADHLEKGVPPPRTNQEEGLFSLRKTLVIVTALMINQFLATTDATIVSTSLPTIVADLHGSQNQYAWVGVAYLLTQTACQPLYGKLADIFGRKCVLYTSTTIFLVGSALCGAAQDMLWLIIARGLAGVGGGGIVNSVWTITTEIVPPRTKAKWSQALSVTWSASAVAGPILGGVFSGEVATGFSWRWAFWINIPIGLIALAIIAWCLRNVPNVRKTTNGERDMRSSREVYHDILRNFDYLGLVLLMGSTSALVIGFSFAGQEGWNTPRTLGLILTGIGGLLVAFVWETYVGSRALLPPGIFKQATVVNVLVISILHNFAFNAGTYFIPVYYQVVDGASPFKAGMRVLPFSLGSALASVPAAQFISFRTDVAWINRSLKISIGLGMALATIGYGLMITLNERSNIWIQELYPLLAGIGIGMLFHTPFQVVTNLLPKQDLASATGAFFLVRFIGTTTGLSVAGAVFNSNWFENMPEAFLATASNPQSVDLRTLAHLLPLDLRDAVLAAVSLSLSRIWTVCAPCLGVAFLLSLFLNVRHHESHTTPDDQPATDPRSDDDSVSEKGSSLATTLIGDTLTPTTTNTTTK